MSDSKEYRVSVSLKAEGKPKGGDYTWTLKGNDSFVYLKDKSTIKKDNDEITLTAKKPGKFNVKVKYDKSGKSAKATSEVIIPYELTAYFKTEFQMQSDSAAIKKNEGEVLDYVVLQGVADNPEHYDFKTHEAMTYIQVWLEEYNADHHDHGEDFFELRCDPDCLNFYRSEEEGVRKIKKLTKSLLIYKTPGTNRKGYTVFLSAKGVKKESEDVKIWLELVNPDQLGKESYKDIGKGRIYLENAVEDRQRKIEYNIQLKRDVEDVDFILSENVLSFLRSDFSGSPAYAQACIQKCGTKKTKSHVHINDLRGKDKAKACLFETPPEFTEEELAKINLSVNKIISARNLSGAEAEDVRMDLTTRKKDKQRKIKKPIKYIKDNGDWVRYDPSTHSSNNLYNKVSTTDSDEIHEMYTLLLNNYVISSAGSARVMHPLLLKTIKIRLKKIVDQIYIPNRNPANNCDPSIEDGVPGFHAEVLAVNEVITAHLKNDIINPDANMITVTTIDEFENKFHACANCTIILGDLVRIPNGKQPK